MISILVPTRNRVEWFKRMLNSIEDTRKTNIEVIAYVDDDDPQLDGYRKLFEGVGPDHLVVGPRIILTQCWNECFKVCHGDIVCQGNDDIEFRTPGWDWMVEQAFENYSDKILLVHGNDGSHRGEVFGPHPFVHRKWVETLGYFIPPYFSSDYGDLWNHDLATALNRRGYLPFLLEHLHPGFGKAPLDQTHRERLERHKADNVEKIWENTLPQRLADIEKLRAVMS